MTLFRKVFQNQSRPATEDEALDEDALREAFMETSDKRVLPLDPFAVAGEEDDPEAFEEELETDVMDQLGLGAEEAPLADDSFEIDDAPEGVEDDAEAEEDFVEAVSAADTAEDDVAEEEDDGGADIAAVLAQTRMMETAPTVEVEQEEMPAESWSEGEEASEEVVALEENPTEADVSTADNPDIVAFAQQQLQAVESAEPAGDPAPVDLSNTAPLSAVPAPVPGRAGRRAGRVKTRLLGFNRAEPDANDPFGSAENATAKPQHDKFPVGWLVVVEGPGIGHSFSIFTGASMIGRGDDQVIKLDFGDNSISRHNHAAIAYDEEENKFYIGHGGKSNIIRRNARPVLSTEELQHADLIRIGETTLRFVALCGSDFKWETTEGGDAPAL
ncbi:FHA domain-containing protein [uncultured Roseobacter sp.]|uniref:FHA domain-containing protein n=1 Tax=uncultured Roseobacter sp. TaxID=114847 RepID=UPI0026312000|nr:FHA domain-containing protein [uncultured Roseobacter sp.]